MLSPIDQLHNLRDSLMTAAAKYEDGDIEVRFATKKQVQAINIALGAIVPEAKSRESRVMLLAYIAGRNPRYFGSSKDLTFEEASVLLDRIYDTTKNKEFTWKQKRPEPGQRIMIWSVGMQIWTEVTYFDAWIEWDDASHGTIVEIEDEFPKWHAIEEVTDLSKAATREEIADAIRLAWDDLTSERKHHVPVP